MRPTTFFVIRYKTLLMQRLLDAVRHGYHHYTSGQVPAEKALAFCQKFAERYDVALNRDQRAYRKRLGKGNARLVLADLAKSGVLHWFLLVSEGDHPARQQEPLRDALDSSTRIRVDDYELLRLVLVQAIENLAVDKVVFRAELLRFERRDFLPRIDQLVSFLRDTKRSPIL